MFELLLDTEFLTFSDKAVLVKEGIIFEINETGEEIIRMIIKGLTINDIKLSLMEKFSIPDENELDKDINYFFEFLLKNNLARRVD
ncbi:PqqD family protein [Enterococcus cecorum]|uniref:PqqD family protein n=1 Tax=Enterococcus cecorum TaxID=44008 RepID=UPI00200AB37D|nr:PqqD family protein [Enterococcus cecorum]MDZ5585312.1 PqqD family protein [Enterococcus cecorum]